jgi:two-component system OmpR family sensor kinase
LGSRRPTGLRARLIVSVGAVVMVTVAVAFAAVYHQTGVELQSQLDQSIRSDARQFADAASQQPGASPRQVLRAAQAYAHSQPYRNAAVLLFAVVPGYGTASNHEELVTVDRDSDDGESETEQAQENAEARRLATPRPGYRTEYGADVGKLRVYQQSVALAGGLHLYAGAAEPLTDIEHAQNGVLRSFVLGGALALVLALGFAYLTGTRMSAPLRVASRVAAEIDGGELTPRMQLPPRSNRDLQVLAAAFNHMLDRLTAAFAAQTEFVADASHELRTPLTVIRGQLELLAGGQDVDRTEVVRVERLIQAEIARLTRLTDDLLLLARSDSADFLRRQPVELSSFITELWDGLSLTARRRFEVGPIPEVTISADPDRLAQALRNLGANAVTHTIEPDGLVRISATLTHTVPKQVRIIVADDGPGIPAEQRQQVFERFYRTDPGRARSQGGAGLGLAIVKAIVEAHGGSVRVEGSPDAGASFALDLPFTAT